MDPENRRRPSALPIVVLCALLMMAIGLLCMLEDGDLLPSTTTTTTSDSHGSPLLHHTHPVSGSTLEVPFMAKYKRPILLSVVTIFVTLLIVLAVLLSLYFSGVLSIADTPQDPLDTLKEKHQQQQQEEEELAREREQYERDLRWQSMMWMVGGSAVANLLVALFGLLWVSFVNGWRVKPLFIVTVVMVSLLLQQGLAVLVVVGLFGVYNVLTLLHYRVCAAERDAIISKPTRNSLYYLVSAFMVITLVLAFMATIVALPILSLLALFTVLSPRLVVRRVWERIDVAVRWPATNQDIIRLDDISLPILDGDLLDIRKPAHWFT